MQRRSVTSSQIRSIGYDASARRLEIEFPNHRYPELEGSVYEYDNVPQEVHDGFFAEGVSIGSYFGKTIKSNPKAYPYRKLSAAQEPKP